MPQLTSHSWKREWNVSKLRKASTFQSWTYNRVSNQMWGSRLLIMDRIVEQQNPQEVLSGTEAPVPNSWISRSGCAGWHQDHCLI